jgi:sporulation protein YabP
MADERKPGARHHISMDRRENVLITGVLDVMSFDEEHVVCETEMGVLMLHGLNMHVSKLNLDEGELEIDGEIETLSYEDSAQFAKGKGSLLSKLFK